MTTSDSRTESGLSAQEPDSRWLSLPRAPLAAAAAILLFLAGAGAATVGSNLVPEQAGSPAVANGGVGGGGMMQAAMGQPQPAFDEMAALCNEHMASMTSMTQGTMGQGMR